MILVRRTYVPRAGTGGTLMRHVRSAGDAMEAAGFPKPRIFRTYSGYHGTLIIDQEWDSIETYEASRDAVRNTEAITSIFGEIYPLLETTHHTEILIGA
ncbi:MAG: hypothetical protein HQ478_11150 [Chloroflexi bacterium]|nr:hypothetical protein [Chloroflexota bacterium]